MRWDEYRNSSVMTRAALLRVDVPADGSTVAPRTTRSANRCR